jgi:hypothetical protein
LLSVSKSKWFEINNKSNNKKYYLGKRLVWGISFFDDSLRGSTGIFSRKPKILRIIWKICESTWFFVLIPNMVLVLI